MYRAHWWPEYQKTNMQFIVEMEPKVAELGPEVIPQLEHPFGMKWPVAPLPVEVTYYVAEVGGAYTTEHPGHTTVASGREDNHGPAGVETLFHEGAHTLTDKLATALREECHRQKKECGDLWHAVQFYTVGDVVKRVLSKHGAPSTCLMPTNLGCLIEECGRSFALLWNTIGSFTSMGSRASRRQSPTWSEILCSPTGVNRCCRLPRE